MESEEKFKLFLEIECKKILLDKWVYGEQIQKDPGDEYINLWVSKHADLFRILWDHSKCKSCLKCHECGVFLRIECKEYEQSN